MSGIVPPGYLRKAQAARIENEIRERRAPELAAASFWQRVAIKRSIRQEVRKAVDALSKPKVKPGGAIN